jgi:hypothetical protein
MITIVSKFEMENYHVHDEHSQGGANRKTKTKTTPSTATTAPYRLMTLHLKKCQTRINITIMVTLSTWEITLQKRY